LLQKNNDIIYTAADIEKYHKGLMSSKERHTLEKAALDDPFLADALEGYSAVPVNINQDITELKKRLAGKKNEKSKPIRISFPFPLWKIAALIVLVAGAGLLVYQLGFNNKQTEIAQANKKAPAKGETIEQNVIIADSTTTVKLDSLSKDVAIQQAEKDLGYKKTEPSSALVAPNGKAENIAAESNAVKDDFAKGLTDTTISETATAAAKADDKENELKKSRRNDNAVDKTVAAEKSADSKNKELSAKKKVDADADGVSDRLEGNVAIKPSANNDRRNQGFTQYKATNVFRGRITDANNNAIPFSNITNLQDNIGTYSDARGYFNLTSPDSVLNVQVRSLGFESNNVQLQNKLPENKVLMEEDRSLSARVLDTVRRNTNRFRNNNMVLEEPEPVDGWSNYDLYLVNNLKVPESFRTKQSGGGEVQLSFEIDKNGEPVNISVKKSLCESCDKEAIRLIKEGPKWKRKIKKGKATVTVAF
jgi:hypothetical protein